MADLEPGPRDHLVTQALAEALRSLDDDLKDELPLDPAEGPDRLSRHAMEVRRRGLAGIGSADAQVEVVNTLLRPTDDLSQDDQVADPARVLHGIRRRSPLGVRGSRHGTLKPGVGGRHSPRERCEEGRCTVRELVERRAGQDASALARSKDGPG